MEVRRALTSDGAGANAAPEKPACTKIRKLVVVFLLCVCCSCSAGCNDVPINDQQACTPQLTSDVPIDSTNSLAAGRHWYTIEAASKTSGGPFLSHDLTTNVGLWTSAGSNQLWRITLWEGDVYHIEAARVTNTGKTFLSHNGDGLVDLWDEAGSYQSWRIRNTSPGTYTIEAMVTSTRKFLSHNQASEVDLWSQAGKNQFWRIPGFSPGSKPTLQQPISPQGCADPFVWSDTCQYHMVCTGGRLPYYRGEDITQQFSPAGFALSHHPPSWSKDGNRWAPETVQVGRDNYIFFSSPSYGENLQPHRIGWARATASTGGDGKWDDYAPQQWFQSFHKEVGGEIDPHVYQEGGKYYLLWKTDDNRAGMLTTRLWMQQIAFDSNGPHLQGVAPSMLLESSGLWWVSSWTNGGSLIEGPEIVKQDGYYYLFFASGRFCKADYAEGVARSQNLWGPYEKGWQPVLSTGNVGHTRYDGKTVKIIGPGHAGFVKTAGTWYIIYHGSPGYNCERHAFASPLRFDQGWPRLA